MMTDRVYDRQRDMALGLTNAQRDRLTALRRRRDHLVERVARYPGKASYDSAELSALSWAIRVIEHVAPTGVLKEVG